MEDIFGKVLINNQGEKFDTLEKLGGKTVCVYSSASWCGPCKAFTPKLIELYDTIKEKGGEVVLMTSDTSESAFTEYFKGMPWLAVPFDQTDIHHKYTLDFNASTLPKLVLLDKEGKLLTASGRRFAEFDPSGKNFPWKDKSVSDILESVVDSKGEPKSLEELKKCEAIIFYMGSSISAPCKKLTPSLIQAYNTINKEKTRTEVIYVGFDSDENNHNLHVAELPFLSIPFKEFDDRNALREKFDIIGLPGLIVYDLKNDEILSDNAREMLLNDPNCESFPWTTPDCLDLNRVSMGKMNNGALIVVLADCAPEKEMLEARAMVDVVAHEYVAKWGRKQPPMYFSFGTEGITGQALITRIRKFLKLQPDQQKVQVVIAVGREGKKYPFPSDKFTEETFRSFIESFLNNKLEGEDLN